MKGSISSIESFGTVDGPGIRTVIFLNCCKLRCKYCHNPETWCMGDYNYTIDELVSRIVRNKVYFANNGGVTLSGGEPLLQIDFIIELAKKLKSEGINIALDTTGDGVGKYDEILPLVDLVILDIKDITEERFNNLTGGNMNDLFAFYEALKKYNNKLWIRQVVVPEVHDNMEYMEGLNEYIKKYLVTNNIEKIEFLPYHKLGTEKYKKLGIFNPYKDKLAMDEDICNDLYNKFMNIYKGD